MRPKDNKKSKRSHIARPHPPICNKVFPDAAIPSKVGALPNSSIEVLEKNEEISFQFPTMCTTNCNKTISTLAIRRNPPNLRQRLHCWACLLTVELASSHILVKIQQKYRLKCKKRKIKAIKPMASVLQYSKQLPILFQ